MANPIVPELEVLIASAVFLWKRGVQPASMSISRQSRTGGEADRLRLKAELERACIPTCPIYRDGEDLIAKSRSELWHVECKGSPSKRDDPSCTAPYGTHRNQFDRALASVVSYYDRMQEEAAKSGLAGYLALALPVTDHYLRELKRAGKQLRARLNLWVLLFDSNGQKVIPVGPGDEYPHW